MNAIKRRFITAIAAVVISAATAAAQAVMVAGTGDPNLDVPAVQAAVDQGGQVVLTGHFSFDKLPTPAAASNGRMILVSKEVVISGTRDEHGEMTTIEGGIVPFVVEAPGAPVTIQGLRFVRPKEGAIWINAVSGLVIAYCRIEGVEPLPDPTNPAGAGPVPISRGIRVNTNLSSPTTGQPGQPEDISGTLAIFNNDIDLGAMAGTNTIGIGFDTVGKPPDQEVDIYVSGNNIRNSTGRLLLFVQIGGRAHVERNILTTGAAMLPSGGVVGGLVEGIKFQASGSYLIAHNSIDCAYANGAAIRGLDQGGRPEARAIVADNNVTMSAPEGTVFGTESAGIEIRGLAQGNMVLNNSIRGRASFALSVVGQSSGAPGNNTLVMNGLEGFQSSRADAFVGAGVSNTLVVGTQGTVEDHGIGTLIVPRTF